MPVNVVIFLPVVSNRRQWNGGSRRLGGLTPPPSEFFCLSVSNFEVVSLVSLNIPTDLPFWGPYPPFEKFLDPPYSEGPLKSLSIVVVWNEQTPNVTLTGTFLNYRNCIQTDIHAYTYIHKCTKTHTHAHPPTRIIHTDSLILICPHIQSALCRRRSKCNYNINRLAKKVIINETCLKKPWFAAPTAREVAGIDLNWPRNVTSRPRAAEIDGAPANFQPASSASPSQKLAFNYKNLIENTRH